jgi:hypothetical protein
MGAPWYLVIAGNIVAAFVSYRIVERPGMAIGRALLVKSAVPAPANRDHDGRICIAPPEVQDQARGLDPVTDPQARQ